VNASTVSVNESIQFTDESSDSDGSISSWSWDFGDGLSSTATDPVYSFSEAGNYTVELVVEDDKGATDSTTESVTVEEESSNDDDGGDGSAGGGDISDTDDSDGDNTDVPDDGDNEGEFTGSDRLLIVFGLLVAVLWEFVLFY